MADGATATAMIQDTPITFNLLVFLGSLLAAGFTSKIVIDKAIDKKILPIQTEMKEIKEKYVTCEFCKIQHDSLNDTLRDLKENQKTLHQDVKQILTLLTKKG